MDRRAHFILKSNCPAGLKFSLAFAPLRFVISLFALVLLASVGQAQDFMMQGWYWNYPKPGCNNYNGLSIASDMAGRAAEQSAAGFTMMWLPPMAKASFGNCSNGYDPQDLYDYGQVSGQTGLGTGAEVEAWIAALAANGIFPVADVVYNHRDGGEWEDNPAVRDYVLNYPTGGGCGGFPATPYPVNGKMRYALPLGGSSGNGAGDYFFKFQSASGENGFNGRSYKLFFRTQNTVFNPVSIDEVEPNGGGDCGQANTPVLLGQDVFATQEVGSSCDIDEFYLPINTGDFLAAGDMLEIYIEEVGGGGEGIDQRIFSIWSAARSENIHGELKIQTRTDFTALPSGQGGMNYLNFKPNGAEPTCMTGDEERALFFFDVEQTHPTTGTTYRDWNNWLWDNVGIRGFRMDAVKHFPAWFVSALLNELHAAGKNPPMVVGEHFTSDAGVLKGWVDAVTSNMNPSAVNAINVRAFDFELRQALKEACDNGFYDVRNIFQQGMVDGVGANSFNVVSFVNNHDYRTLEEHILNRQMLAYAYILTNNRVGLPSVFHPDYYGIDIYGPANPLAAQQTAIDELMQVHKDYITGAPFVDYLNRFNTPYGSNYQQSGAFDHLLYQIQGGVGGKDVIVLINFEGQPLRFNHTINTANAPLGTIFDLVAGTANETNPVVENNPFNGLPNSLYFKIPAYSYAVFLQGGIVPVEFLSFEGEKKGRAVELTWQTATETNNEGFRVQRSADGQEWQTIGFVPGHGTTQNTQAYRYTDDSPQRGLNYYRLQQIDYDGTSAYSSVVSINMGASRSVGLLFPNPTTGRIYLNDTATERVEVYDQMGRLVLHLSGPIRELDLSALPAATYVVKITDGTKVENTRVLKQ